jgi:GTP-binding protein
MEKKTIIKKAEFNKSSSEIGQCPPPNKPEFAFIGRSNVGKSSLINMVTGHKKLAKTSGRPGKTQLINHFDIDDVWYLVDLPGYGYAKVSKTEREKWDKMIKNYLKQRENLFCTFVLIDSRLDPQKNDLEFIDWLGQNEIPLALIFTKIDKISINQVQSNVAKFRKVMKKKWADIPPLFVSSSETTQGREEVLGFIRDVIAENSDSKRGR